MKDGADSGDEQTSRPRVLISAYACGPSDESEASAGWAFARAAAVHHDVWLITRRRFEAGISRALAEDSNLAAHMTVHYVELSDRLLAAKRAPRDVYWYYTLWQRKVGRVAAALHSRIHFDVAHHVTFASDWLPCGLGGLREVPLVWGPVGGSTYLPLRFIHLVGARNAPGELCRGITTRLARRIFSDRVARRAAIVAALNHDVARRFSFARRIVVEANAALVPTEPAATPAATPARGDKRAIFVGRIVGWKGCRLAVAAIARPSTANWRLDFFGAGRDQRAVEAMANRLGVSDRVRFHGHRPRADVLRALADVDALLFPSMHDSAPWVTAEASAAGCPVVCLDAGGPPLLAGPNAHAVPVGRRVVDGLAAALVEVGERRGIPYDRWSADRLPTLLAEWYADAISSVNAGSSAEQ